MDICIQMYKYFSKFAPLLKKECYILFIFATNLFIMMKEKKYQVQVVTFSPTRTSSKIATQVSKGLGYGAVNFIEATYLEPSKTTFTTDDIVLVIAPVYAGRVAKLALERFKNLKGDHTPVIPIVVYGNRHYDDAWLELNEFLAERGFVTLATGNFVGEHSYSSTKMPLAEGRPDQEDKQKAFIFGQEIAQLINAFVRVSSDEQDLAQKIKAHAETLQVPGHKPYKPGMGGPKDICPEVDLSICTHCGKCVTACPNGVITLMDGIFTNDTVKCIQCMACVKICPQGARSFFTPVAEKLFNTCKERREPEWLV